MLPTSAVCAAALAFIAGMTWLRTRLQYRQERGPLRLTGAGAGYFAALLALLGGAWFAAPPLVGASPAQVILGRVVGFLAIYLLFIPVHRALRTAGHPAFAVRADPSVP